MRESRSSFASGTGVPDSHQPGGRAPRADFPLWESFDDNFIHSMHSPRGWDEHRKFSTAVLRRRTEVISPARKCREASREKERVPVGDATMAQHTYNANFVHCVFSTKNRKNTIPSELQESLWAYLLGIAN